MGVNVHIKGAEKLLSTLSKAPTLGDVLLSGIVKNATEEHKNLAKSYAPKDTGYLKDNIKTYYPKKHVGVIDSEAGYSGFQEYGTRFQSGTAYMKPATDDINEKYQEEFKGFFEKVFK